MSTSRPTDGQSGWPDDGIRIALYQRWVWCCGIGVPLGLAMVLILGWKLGPLWPYRFSPVWARGWAPPVLATLLGAMVQYLVLGLVQALALRPAYPRLSVPRWVVATTLAGALTALAFAALSVAILPRTAAGVLVITDLLLRAFLPACAVALVQSRLLASVAASHRGWVLHMMAGWVLGPIALMIVMSLWFVVRDPIGAIALPVIGAVASGVVLGLVSGRAFRFMPPRTAPRSPP